MPDKESTRELELKGTGVSGGVAVATALVWNDTTFKIHKRELKDDEIDQELLKLEKAIIDTRKEIMEMKGKVEKRSYGKESAIFDAHLMILEDPLLMQDIMDGIIKYKWNSEYAVDVAVEKYIKVIESIGDNFMKERISDVKDVIQRIFKHLLKLTSCGSIIEGNERYILVAHDLTPSETVNLDRKKIIGFATDLGTSTSHTALLAKSLRIPAIVGIGNITSFVTTGQKILIDGNTGTVIINPREERLRQFNKISEIRNRIVENISSKHGPAVTLDNRRIILAANIESVDEIDSVKHSGAEGVGLFRTEYLFMNKGKVISEEEQYKVYLELSKRLAPVPVVIRTLDLGGDKISQEFNIPEELNPFLGCRSIRLCLKYPELLKTQMKAILRANYGTGNIRLMYPMISTIEELEQANALLDQVEDELAREKKDFTPLCEVGMLVEIPVTALMADEFAKRVDFFSIGTNDLIQYTMAADRTNRDVSNLYQPLNPAILKLIKMVIESAHRHGIWVGVCGEMASDPLAVPLLVGLGIDELSMAPSVVGLIRQLICSLNFSELEEIAKEAINCNKSEHVVKLSRNIMEKYAPEILEFI